MATIKLWLKAKDIPELTAFSGNIDVDNLNPHIYIAQTTDLKRVLGLDLYNKIYTDYVNDALAGDYAVIFENYIIDMLVYFSCSYFVSFSSVKVANNGNNKPVNSVESKESSSLSAKYLTLANNSVTNFQEFMKTIHIPEYNSGEKRNENNLIPWF